MFIDSNILFCLFTTSFVNVSFSFVKSTRQGIKNWKHLRPWKAFTPKMLATGPTPAAGLGTALWAGSLIGDYMKKNVPVSNFVSGRNAGRSAFKQLKIKKKNE